MKLIESKAEYIPQESGLEGIYKMVELAGRTAYHSQDKITPDSAKDFVDRMIKSKHGAALEAGTVYLKTEVDYSNREYLDLEDRYNKNPYSKINFEAGIIYISSNMRVLQENNWLDDLKYLCDPTEFHEKRYTMRFITDIGVCRELLRHRVFSFLNESTRYCNYSKGKFGGEVTFISPSWYHHDQNATWEDMKSANFREICEQTEAAYLNSIKNGATPQEARQVLPFATKTELIMTGFASDWARLYELRLYESTGKVAPDMKILMQKAWKEFENYGIARDLERYIKL